MAGEKLVKNFTYVGEPDELLVPDWVQRFPMRVPRLKPEYRTSPNAPWSPNEKAIKEIEELEAEMKKVKEMMNA